MTNRENHRKMQPHRYIFNLQLTTAVPCVPREGESCCPRLQVACCRLNVACCGVSDAAGSNINIDSINYKNIKCQPTNVIKRIKNCIVRLQVLPLYINLQAGSRPRFRFGFEFWVRVQFQVQNSGNVVADVRR